MELSALTPEERVFHIDDECYLFYLGSDRDDERPFARIGTSKKLTERMIDNISSIIITDSPTGNPLLEPENINTNAMGTVRYVGDKKTVENYLDFIHNYNVQNGHISSLEDIKKSHDRAEVLFFKDGNARLQYNRIQIFDLKRAEKQDLHFNERALRLKGIIAENRLRYTPEDFDVPGFFIEGDNFFLFQNKKIAAFGLPDSYFETLAKRGIDPDWIDTVISDEVTYSLIQLFKRKQATGKKIRILTANEKIMHSAAALFRGSQHNPLNTEIEKFSTGDTKKFGRYTIEKGENTIITYPRIPFSLCITARHKRPAAKQMFIIPSERVLLPPRDSFRKDSIPLTDGVPYIFLNKFHGAEDEVERFFSEVVPLCEYVNSESSGHHPLVPDESKLLNMFTRFFDDIRTNSFTRRTTDTLYAHLKRIKSKDISCLAHVLTNIAGLIHRIAKAGTTGEMQNTLKKIADRCDRVADTLSPHFPLVGELILEKEKLQLFYRSTRHPVTREDCISFQDGIADIQILREEKDEVYRAGINRLNALIDELESGATRKASTREAVGAGAAPDSGRVTAPGIEKVSVRGLGIPAGGRAGIRKGSKRGRRAKPAPEIETQARVSVTGLGIPAGRRKDAEETKRARRIKILVPVSVIAVAVIVLAALLLIPGTKLHERVSGVGQGTVESSSQTSTPSTGIEGGQQKKGVFSISVGDESSPYHIEVQITILDIYYLTNEIAVQNGYRKMDSPEDTGMDPDWIYPGNLFILPDETRYTVIKGDTMWDIAHQFIKKTLENDWPVYMRVAEEIDNPDKRTHDRETLKNELESLKARSFSENFSREIDKKIAKLMEEQ